MNNRSFKIRKRLIMEQVHCGVSFVSAVEFLEKALAEKNETEIKNAYTFIKMYGLQSRLPDKEY
jgi:hypothetical protein